MNLLKDNAIISINSSEFSGLEGEEYIKAVTSKLNLDNRTVRNLYYHFMKNDDVRKSSILIIPHIL